MPVPDKNSQRSLCISGPGTMTASGGSNDGVSVEKKRCSSGSKKKTSSMKGYHWQPAQYKLSPNELDRLMKEERERRRKIRIVQVG